MKRRINVAVLLSLGMAVATLGLPVQAQDMPGKTAAGRTTGPAYEVSPEVRRFREMAGLMRDMSQQMNRMQESMANGEMSPESRTRMQQQLKAMSELMRRMSGLADRPSMSDPETKKQTESMRRQMKEMMQAHP